MTPTSLPRVALLIPLLLPLGGCDRSYETMPYYTCTTAKEVIPADDASLGFTRQDVLDLLQANLPSEVLWDEMTQTGASEPLSLTLLGAEGETYRVTPEGSDCAFSGPALGMLVRAQLTIGDGAATTEGLLAVTAPALDTAAIRVADATAYGSPWSSGDIPMPAALNAGYQGALEDYLDAEKGGDPTLDEIYLSVGTVGDDESWERATVGIGATYTAASEGVLVAWIGHWR